MRPIATPLEIIMTEGRASRTVIVDILNGDRGHATWEVEPYALDSDAVALAVICHRLDDEATVSIPIRDVIAARASGRAFSPRRDIAL